MDVGIGHLQRPAAVDVGQLGAAVVAGLAVGGVGEGHAHATFFAFGIGDGEAHAKIRGSIYGQGTLREIDSYRSDGRSGSIKTEGEVVTLAESLGNLHQTVGGEGCRFGGGRRGWRLGLHLRLGGFGVLRRSLGLAGGGGRRRLQ